MSGIKGIARRLTWGLADQAVSSLTNFVVGVYVAHELGVAGFGVFTLAWVTYGVVLNLSRGLSTDPLVVRFSGVSHDRWSAATAGSCGTAITVGAGFGVLSVLAGLAMGGSVGGAFVALGVVTPALLLQDSWRFAFFANGQGHRAVANDLLWTVAMIPLLLLAAKNGDVAGFVLAWGGAALFAGVGGWLQTGIRPRPRQTRVWMRQHRDLGTRYMVENSANSGAGQLRMYGVAAIVDVGAVGAIRGAELLLAPFMTLLMGLNLVTVPEAARVLRRAPHRLERFCAVLGGTQAVAALGWGLALLFLVPAEVGHYVLNDVWHYAAPLILPVTVSLAAAGVIAGAAAGLRALGAARRSLRVQLISSVGYLGGGLAGAFVGGALGASWGSTILLWCGAVLWWLQLRAGLRDHAAEQPMEPATVAWPRADLDSEEMRTP
jgi:O-antigen/teichoic acid export membrane protein